MLPLTSEQQYDQAYYSKSTSAARNYLFIHGQSNEQHWLYENNQQLVIEANELLVDGGENDERQTQAIFYQVVTRDSDQDNRLSGKDLKTLSISQPDGKGYKALVEGVDVFVGLRLVDEKTLLIVYQKQEGGYSAKVSLSNFELMHEKALPTIRH